MGNPVLYFFLLVLRVSFNFTPNIIHKCNRFSKVYLEKGLKFVLSEGCGLTTLDPDVMLLSTKVDPISKEQSCKKEAFVAFRFSNFEIVLALLTKVVIFDMQVSNI